MTRAPPRSTLTDPFLRFPTLFRAGRPGQRNTADAGATERHRVQADRRAQVARLPALHALEREAQADLVLPADLARRQRAAAVMQAVVELAQSVGRDLAADFDYVLLFDLVAVLGQPPPHAAVLGQHHQAAGLGIERHQRRQRSEEHTSELQSLMRNSYAVFCLKTKINQIY